MTKKRIGIVGSTGSIGRQALDVIRLNRELFDISFLCANSSEELLKEQAAEFGVDAVCLAAGGAQSLVKLIREQELDLVLVAAVGAAGIVPAWETVNRGIDLALANKESIVAAGRIILDRAKETGASVIPVDSEHSAIHQCLMGQRIEDVQKVILTASGGAFRNTPNDALGHVGVSEALNHPNWSMGSKITVDSATMMNKGLELIEARFLFDIDPSILDVVIHPQSIIHSAVQFIDGSTLAQLGWPDMRTPISFAMGLPSRLECGVKPLDLFEVGRLDFRKPDYDKYRCLALALEVLKKDNNGPMIVMNAANEIAVEQFLLGNVSYLGIAEVIEETLSIFDTGDFSTLEEVFETDKKARETARYSVKRMNG
ncbi:1-deoxy-D-xylulose-5-phosphate reductoisomerase [Limisalsivibrio acetivorans]|uniref:1-deoxy-D-xylulose-5-phosphate reductoisomerase n=1 Tax=Limisalsivibrio acetivorans TaxID=1304888 RepID=UPI0003B41474|nr:1-deoxy-D-xylulose-5-phosphate reductoisomerase [Limisalsivibrio acetivorans]